MFHALYQDCLFVWNILQTVGILKPIVWVTQRGYLDVSRPSGSWVIDETCKTFFWSLTQELLTLHKL